MDTAVGVMITGRNPYEAPSSFKSGRLINTRIRDIDQYIGSRAELDSDRSDRNNAELYGEGSKSPIIGRTRI